MHTTHPGNQGGEVILETRPAPLPPSVTDNPFIEDDRCRYTHLYLREEENE